MQLEDFTKDDLGILIEAVDTWISKDSSAEIMELMLISMMGRGDKQAGEAEMERQKEKYKQARQSRSEIAILLKAKLLLAMKDMAVGEPEGRESGEAQ